MESLTHLDSVDSEGLRIVGVLSDRLLLRRDPPVAGLLGEERRGGVAGRRVHIVNGLPVRREPSVSWLEEGEECLGGVVGRRVDICRVGEPIVKGLSIAILRQWTAGDVPFSSSSYSPLAVHDGDRRR